MTEIFLEIHLNRNREKYGPFKKALVQGLSISSDHKLVSSRGEAELIICADCSEAETRRLREELKPEQKLVYAVPNVDWRGFARKKKEFSPYGAEVVIEKDLFGRLELGSRMIEEEGSL